MDRFGIPGGDADATRFEDKVFVYTVYEIKDGKDQEMLTATYRRKK